MSDDVTARQLVSLSRERIARRKDASGLVEEVVDFAARTGRQIADLERRIAELERLCDTDELTELSNRRGLATFLERALGRCVRYGHSGVALWFDLDDFKRLNDRYGHAAGDAAIIEVSRRIGAHLRPSDCGARIGGDEFVVVCEPVSVAACAAIADRFQAAIEAEPVSLGHISVPVSVSVGWAMFDGTASVASVLDDADRAMYRVKAGRTPDRRRSPWAA